MATVNQLLTKAAGEIGYSRWSDPKPGTKYGRWYESVIDKCSTNYDFGASGVPYCAMFVAWVLAQVGATCVGMPIAYCPSGVASAKSKGKLRVASSAKPGDVVYFDWGGDGVSDHVGFVEKNTGGYLQCIEGNTTLNGKSGGVARRTRAYSTVVGVVTPDYDGTVTNATPTATVTQQAAAAVSGNRLSIDGLWGCNTTRALQKALGTTQDGIVSDQYSAYKAKNPGLMSASWEWHSKTGAGSDVIRALQRKVGANVDGCAGDETFTKLQGYLGTEQDGYISRPSVCVKALQRKLSSGKF